AGPGASDHRHHEVPALQLRDSRTDLDHPAEALVAEDEKVGSGRSLAVLGVLDFPVRPVDANTEHLHPDAASIGHVGHSRIGKLGEVGAARPTRESRDGLHDALLLGSSAAVSAAGISWLCCSSLATSPVQPVWWDAPTPEPSSPWKYSWKGMRSRK